MPAQMQDSLGSQRVLVGDLSAGVLGRERNGGVLIVSSVEFISTEVREVKEKAGI